MRQEQRLFSQALLLSQKHGIYDFEEKIKSRKKGSSNKYLMVNSALPFSASAPVKSIILPREQSSSTQVSRHWQATNNRDLRFTVCCILLSIFQFFDYCVKATDHSGMHAAQDMVFYYPGLIPSETIISGHGTSPTPFTIAWIAGNFEMRKSSSSE